MCLEKQKDRKEEIDELLELCLNTVPEIRDKIIRNSEQQKQYYQDKKQLKQ